jgi:N-acetylmuramic acid 6-phosphate (MurNAc-6-P) etherase
VTRQAPDSRITERRNPRTANIDLASAIEIVDLMNAEDRTVADAVATQREEIAKVVSLTEDAFRRDGRLFYVGAGTSGRLGILDASECPADVRQRSGDGAGHHRRWISRDPSRAGRRGGLSGGRRRRNG